MSKSLSPEDDQLRDLHGRYFRNLAKIPTDGPYFTALYPLWAFYIVAVRPPSNHQAECTRVMASLERHRGTV